MSGCGTLPHPDTATAVSEAQRKGTGRFKRLTLRKILACFRIFRYARATPVFLMTEGRMHNTIPSSPPLLELREVTRTFAVRRGFLSQSVATVHAVDGVSLSMRSGETLGLVGESGCGKSTLGRMIVGLLPPSSGDILLEGASLLHSRHIRKERPEGPAACPPRPGRVQMIFQDPFSSLNPRLSVGASIGEPLAALRVSRRERRERAAEMLRLVGLNPDLAGRYPHEFSGGQRQRIAIARALITRPSLVVCDEAVSALDASVQAQVLNLLKDIQAEFSPAYVFISHDLNVVGYMSRNVAVMYLGRVVEFAPRETLFSCPAHPYTQILLAASPSRDPDQRASTIPAGGELPSPLDLPTGCTFHPRCPQVMAICRRVSPPEYQIAPAHRVSCHLYG